MPLSSSAPIPDGKAGKATAAAVTPQFAAVEIQPDPTPVPVTLSRMPLPTPSAVSCAFRFPHGVETPITGLDADAVTLLVLELVAAAARTGA